MSGQKKIAIFCDSRKESGGEYHHLIYTIKNIKKNNFKKLIDIESNTKQTVIFSKKFQIIEAEIKQFLKTKMYNNKNVMKKNDNGKKIIKNLFKIILSKPNKYIKSDALKNDKYRTISDYISGMTDRFAIQLYKSLK